jgi:hypothetical protein
VRLQSVPSFDAQHTKQRCISEQDYSLLAEVHCAMNQRQKLEKLYRYITRPVIANERLILNSAECAETEDPVNLRSSANDAPRKARLGK